MSKFDFNCIFYWHFFSLHFWKWVFFDGWFIFVLVLYCTSVRLRVWWHHLRFNFRYPTKNDWFSLLKNIVANNCLGAFIVRVVNHQVRSTQSIQSRYLLFALFFSNPLSTSFFTPTLSETPQFQEIKLYSLTFLYFFLKKKPNSSMCLAIKSRLKSTTHPFKIRSKSQKKSSLKSR